jgi:hypothetical protein
MFTCFGGFTCLDILLPIVRGLEVGTVTARNALVTRKPKYGPVRRSFRYEPFAYLTRRSIDGNTARVSHVSRAKGNVNSLRTCAQPDLQWSLSTYTTRARRLRGPGLRARDAPRPVLMKTMMRFAGPRADLYSDP